MNDEEDIWTINNRIDAQIAASQDRMQQQRDAQHYIEEQERIFQYERHKLAEQEKARELEKFEEQQGPPLSLGIGAAVTTFLLLLWGSQYLLFQLSRIFGVADPASGLQAVTSVNGILIALLLIGVVSGWWAWLRSKGIVRAVGRILLFTVLALGVSTWLLAQGPRTDTSTPETAFDAATSSATTQETSAFTAPAEVPPAPVTTRVVTADALMLRAEPSISALVITKLYTNQEVSLLGDERQVDDMLWVYVQFGEYKGWVSATYLEEP